MLQIDNDENNTALTFASDLDGNLIVKFVDSAGLTTQFVVEAERRDRFIDTLVML